MHFHMTQIRTVDYCISTMRAHPAASDVVSNGCRLLSNLVLHDEVRDLCVKDGCLPLVIAAMSAFPQDVDVNHYGCWALLNLSQNGTFLPVHHHFLHALLYPGSHPQTALSGMSLGLKALLAIHETVCVAVTVLGT